ncbi:MAG: riboflavin synthase [Sphaerochaetaceae bacterium]|nr:riboflavin synthase [Sphaerochaetaceae bacterium]
MFTGLIEEVGALRSREHTSLTIACTQLQDDLALGDSVAVNGVCLTVTWFDRSSLRAEVMPVTLRTTNLGSLRKDEPVHLERAMKITARLGGHLVAGHVDATIPVLAKAAEKDALLITLAIPKEFQPFIIHRGSVALDGVSLTVADLSEKDFTVSLVGHTRDHTALADRRVGQQVNLECDQIGKYVYHQLSAANGSGSQKITYEMLSKEGFL